MSKEIDQISGCIGNDVNFVCPEGPKHGILKDRSVFESGLVWGVPYWDVVDHIKFDDEEEHCIRIGYYRMSSAMMKPIFAGQTTTITEPVSVWKKLLVKAAREKTWFRDLLDGVMEELEKPTIQ